MMIQQILTLSCLLFVVTGLSFDDRNEQDFTGTIQSLPTGGLIGDWKVSGTTVHVIFSTQIEQDDAPIVSGACVEVKGQALPDFSVNASEIKSREGEDCGKALPNNPVDITGAIQGLPNSGLIGDWQVLGRTVHVFSTTVIQQQQSAIVMGTCVEVKGQALPDTSINASEIDVKSVGACGAVANNQVEILGVIQMLPQSGFIGDWTVAGRTVHVSSATQLKQQQQAPFATGTCTDVKGQLLADSSIVAAEIDSEPGAACGVAPMNPVELHGTVQKLPPSGVTGDWQVDSQTVHVFASTRIEQEHGPVAVGSCVEVTGQAAADGSINAVGIDVESSSEGCDVKPAQPPQDLLGLVQMLPASGFVGDWQVSGRTVHVLSTTSIRQENGVIAAGACVDVEGTVQADMSISSSEIDVRPAAACSAAIGGVMADFNGTIEKLPSAGLVGDWQVSGRTIHVLPGTEIDPSPAASIATGLCVEVNGRMLADQTIDALSIEAKPMAACSASGGPIAEVMGLVEKLPAGSLVGDWQVSGKTVHILPATKVDQEHGAVTLGSCVEAKGSLLADQSLNATVVEVESVSGTCISGPGVVDAASLSSGVVSPGEIVSLFGMRLGPPGLASLQLTPDGKVSTSLCGVHVLFDGQPAPLLSVTDNAVNAVVPFSVAGKSITQIQVENEGAWSNPVSISVAEAHPGLFTMNESGSGGAAALNEDGSVNSSAQSASPGSIVVLFATGSGMANRRVEDGEVIEDDQTKAALQVAVQIGGIDADVLFAGMAPKLVAGVLQVNVRIPRNAPVGSAVPVQIKVGNFSSPAAVTLSIR